MHRSHAFSKDQEAPCHGTKKEAPTALAAELQAWTAQWMELSRTKCIAFTLWTCCLTLIAIHTTPGTEVPDNGRKLCDITTRSAIDAKIR